MPIDRDLLQRLSTEPTKEPSGVEGLLRSIHRAPVLRDWVTLESTALAPVPVKRGGRWRIVSLLAVPTRLEDNSAGMIAPWEAIEWSWPEKKVVQTTDLRLWEETASLRQPEIIAARPAAASATLEPRERQLREKALFRAIDEIVSHPPSEQANLASLAGQYAGLLPAEIYPYYWALIPESQEWLHPDALPPALKPPDPGKDTPAPDRTEEQEAQPQGTVSGGTPPSQPSVEAKTPIPQPLKTPTDLTEQIGPWLGKCLNLAQSFSLDEIATNLQALDARRRLPGFRLAFVGEFSRGKSHLLNQLLNKPLLPEGVTPTTATLSSIVAGSENCMEVKFSQEHKETRPVKESSWNDLLATDRAGTTQEVVAEVRLTLAHPWLQDNDIELLDTPGVEDPNSRRASLVLDLLSQCDAAVLVISATSPFSMTEAAFLEEEMIGRHIPRILVVVSKLDLLSEEDRCGVLEFVRGRVAQISAAIPVLPSYPVDGMATEAETLQAVLTQIESMAIKGERRAWRSRQVAEQLADCLSHLKEIGETAIAAARMSAAQQEQELKKAQVSLRDAELHWESIQIELERRRLQSERALRQKILITKAELAEILTFELGKTPDPKTWWEVDLPFRLRRELIAFGRKAENFLMTALDQDFEWLQTEVGQAFGTKVSQTGASKQKMLEIPKTFEPLSLTDVRHYRLLTRIGSGLAMIGGYLLSGPAGIAASIGAGIISEQILNKKLEEQRQLLSEKLKHSIDRTIDEYCDRVADRLRQLYHKLLEETKREQVAWCSARNTALKASIQETNEPVWQQMIDEVSVLRQAILSALAR